MNKHGSGQYQFREEVIRCALCSKHYTNPRLLPCLHSFCYNCLTSHIQDGNQSVQTIRRDKTKTEVKQKAQSPTRAKLVHPPAKPPGDQPRAEYKSKLTKPGDTKPGPQQHQTSQKSCSPVKIDPKQDVAKYKLGDKGFPCPCCKKFASTPQLPKTHPDKWPELFPENNLLADLVDLHTLKLGTRVCDPCKRNKTSNFVESYCKNCRDALCGSCALTHKGLRSCRHHKVLSTADFAEAIDSLKVEEEFCQIHDDKPMEHYCYIHSALCCGQCVTESHRKCERVVPVSEAVKKCRETGEFMTLDGALQKYNDHVTIVLQDRSALLKKLDTKKVKLMSEFIKVKNHIIAQLEKMEKDLKTILEATHKAEAKKIKHEADRAKEIQSALVNSTEILTVADHHGSDSQVIGMIEKVKTECEFYEESINVLCARLRAVDYDIALDDSLQEVMKRLNQFGRIDVNTTPTKMPPPPKLAATLGLQSSSTKVKAVKPTFTFQGKNAREIGEFCARFEEDVQECWFTGALFMTDGRILLADRTNRKLKLFTGNFNPVSELSVSSKPWDITSVSENEVAVSLPAECKIEFITISGTMITPTRSIFTDEPCFGICHANGKLLTVTYDGDPPNLKILSMTGKELTYVCVDDNGFPLFSKPVYVACSANASDIYVSDERLGCVVILKEMGELNFHSSAMDLGHAAGLTLDRDGNIYVCGSTSNTVHVVSAQMDRVKVLVTGENVSYPRAIAFEPREKKLLVTQGDQDIVKVYSLA